MIAGFERLTEDQFQLTKDAIAWITVLIAGADGKIDEEETAWAAKVTKIRGYHNPNELTAFYELVGAEFSAKLGDLLAHVPTDVKQRTDLLTRKIEQLNDTLPILDNNMGHHLIGSYRSFAKHVAKASGGFLGFFSVSSEESQLIDLPMLRDIPYVEAEDEEE